MNDLNNIYESIITNETEESTEKCRCGKDAEIKCTDCGKPLCSDCAREGKLCQKCYISSTLKPVNKKFGVVSEGVYEAYGDDVVDMVSVGGRNAYKKGYDEGYDKGYIEGYDEGYDKGYNAGEEHGREWNG